MENNGRGERRIPRFIGYERKPYHRVTSLVPDTLHSTWYGAVQHSVREHYQVESTVATLGSHCSLSPLFSFSSMFTTELHTFLSQPIVRTGYISHSPLHCPESILSLSTHTPASIGYYCTCQWKYRRGHSISAFGYNFFLSQELGKLFCTLVPLARQALRIARSGDSQPIMGFPNWVVYKPVLLITKADDEVCLLPTRPGGHRKSCIPFLSLTLALKEKINFFSLRGKRSRWLPIELHCVVIVGILMISVRIRWLGKLQKKLMMSY